MYHVVNDSSNREPSYIKVIDDEEEVLVYLHGPMSMTAAGAFVNAQEGKTTDCISSAMEHWRD